MWAVAAGVGVGGLEGTQWGAAVVAGLEEGDWVASNYLEEALAAEVPACSGIPL